MSSAGKGTGLTGSRSGLWFEFARIVGELRPRWVIVENVASGAKRWVDQVVSGLEQLNYETLPIPLSAADVGAPYPRARVFIVAYTDSYREPVEPINAKVERPSGAGEASETIRKTPDFDSVKSRELTRGSSGSKGAKVEAKHKRHSGWESLPPVDAVVSRFPGRLDHQRALGNAVVPQCAEVIGYMVRELEPRFW